MIFEYEFLCGTNAVARNVNDAFRDYPELGAWFNFVLQTILTHLRQIDKIKKYEAGRHNLTEFQKET